MATSFLAALQFLTVVPPLIRRPFSSVELGRAVGFFPLVGVVIGFTLAGLDLALTRIFPDAVVTALVLAGWVLMTGALHLDGFLDTCDGLWGGNTAESRLRILRDERVGAYAVIGGVLLLLVKFSALGVVTERGRVLILAATLGRWAMVVAIVMFPYGRAEGLGRDMKDQAGWMQAALATVTAGLIGWLAEEWLGLAAMCLAGVATCFISWYVLRRLPGLTGDIYGAICEIVEVLVLLVVVAEGRT